MSDYKIEISDNQLYNRISGHDDQNILKIAETLQVEIIARGNRFIIKGDEEAAKKAFKALHLMIDYLQVQDPHFEFSAMDMEHFCSSLNEDKPLNHSFFKNVQIFFRETGKKVVPKTINQANYLTQIAKNPVTFGLGPAGTGKTYLAVAAAVKAFSDGEVERIVLTRPAVEAGENLGFLPGDLVEKINPYLRPLYDALFEFLGFEKTKSLIEKNCIEIAPLAFMRGRTINNSFIILDEAQNTTKSQLKMFLTRLGANSKMVISGDFTQIDLPKKRESGLLHAMKILKDIDGVQFIEFNRKDICRNIVVERIVAAYEKAEV